MEIGDWSLDLQSNEIARGTQVVKLEAKCAKALACLAQRRGQVVSHDELLDSVWGRYSLSSQSVPVVISKLRSVLGDDRQNPKYIETIPKRGYRLIAEGPSYVVCAQSVARPAFGRTFRYSGFTMVALLLVLLFSGFVGAVISWSGDQPTAVSMHYGSNVKGVEPLFDRAQYLWSLRGRENNLLALDLVSQALKLDPLHAPSNALIARIYTKYDAEYLQMTGIDTVGLARQHLATARHSSPKHPAVMLAEAGISITIDWRPDRGLDLLNSAVAADPQNAYLWRLRAVSLYMLGRLDEAFASQQEAQRLGYQSPHLMLDQVRMYYAARDYRQALQVADQLKGHNLAGVNYYVAASEFALNHHERAMATFVKYLKSADYDLREFEPEHNTTESRFLSLLEAVGPQMMAREHYAPLVLLQMFAGRGEEALAYMESLPTARSTHFMNAMHMLPIFDRFQNDERFQSILRRVGVASLARCVHNICKEITKPASS